MGKKGKKKDQPPAEKKEEAGPPPQQPTGAAPPPGKKKDKTPVEKKEEGPPPQQPTGAAPPPGKKKDKTPAEKKEEGPKPTTSAAPPPQEQPAGAPAAALSGREKKRKQRARAGEQPLPAPEQPLPQEVAGKAAQPQHPPAGGQPQQAMGRGQTTAGVGQVRTSPPGLSQPAGRGQVPSGRGQTPPPGFAQPPDQGGRGQWPAPGQPQQPHQSGRGQPAARGQPAPAGYQQPDQRGRGQTPPVDQRGRGQTPPGDGRGQPAGRGQPTGRGQTPPGDHVGRGQTPPPRFQQARGQTPPAFPQIPEQRGYPQITPPGMGQAVQMPPPGLVQPPAAVAQPTQQPQGSWGRGKAASPPEAAQSQPPTGRAPPQQQPGRGPPQQQPSVAQTQPRPDQSKGAVRRDAGPRGQQPPPQQQAKPGQVQSPVEALTKDVKKLQIVERKVMKSCGTLGRKIQIETNHLPMKLDRIVPKAIHYDITITPDKPKRVMRNVWENFRKLKFPKLHPAFDDVKNVYSPTRIPDNLLEGEVDIRIDDSDRPKKYTVVMKYANEVNLTALVNYFTQKGRAGVPSDALQCIDIVLRNASTLRFVKCAKSFYTRPLNQIVDLGNGMELWHGFFQSAILGWKPYLNVDIKNKAFPKEINVVDLMAEMSRQDARQMDEIDHYTKEDISKHLKGLRVMYFIPNIPSSRRTIFVNSLINTNAKNTTFTNQNGAVDTVYNYFEREKKYKIRYPKLPLIWVGPRDKKYYFPAELCTVMPNQVTQRKLDENQTRLMVRSATTSTNVRKEKIQGAIDKANINEDPCVKAFGISITNQFERLQARVLPPPMLEYRANKQVMPQRGVWRNDQFLDGKSLTNWKVLNLTRIRPDQIEYFCKMFKETATRSCNMRIEPVTKPFDSLNFRDVRLLRQYFEKNTNMELIIVLVPERPADVYSVVKQQAELVVGCLTQCIKDKTMMKSLNPATVSNILLKVNAKLNGTNHCLARVSKPPCLNRPCMIMGADVNHPSPEQRDRPSFAAVTASHDPRAFQYNISWRLQFSGREIIADLEQITYDHLLFFYKKVNYKPEKIIFFRDGVSEGQFREVLNAELQAIRRACVKIQADGTYKPSITFLVVQKRHHTRFFPVNPRDSEDRNNNVPAGTCVDTDIIHPSDIEYYLVSHASIQGVARPTKYRMLWDDNNMTDDEIQSLTYYLCHMYTRCTRSVSYPAPTYYAHLAAKRAFTYFEGKTINMDNLQREQQSHQIKREIIVDKPMFFV